MDEKKIESIAEKLVERLTKEKLTYEEAENALSYASYLLKKKIIC